MPSVPTLTYMSALKPAQIRIRVDAEDGELLEELGLGVLSRADVATFILKAALKAVRAKPGEPMLPSNFELTTGDKPQNRLNEPLHKRK